MHVIKRKKKSGSTRRKKILSAVIMRRVTTNMMREVAITRIRKRRRKKTRMLILQECSSTRLKSIKTPFKSVRLRYKASSNTMLTLQGQASKIHPAFMRKE